MRQKSVLVLGLLCMVCCSSLALAQQGATLKGYVKDPQGASVPGVVVTVTSPNLMGPQSSTTDDEGYYRIGSLPPGLYRLETTLQGFAAYVKADIRMEVGSTIAEDITLGLGTVSEEVTVAGSLPAIDTERSDRSFIVNQSAISAVPLAPRLAYQSIWQMLPGVTGGVNDALGNEGGDAHVNAAFLANEGGQQGTRNQNDAYENKIFIDGMDTNDPMSGRSATSLNFEAIEEVSVKTGGFEAEYGAARSGQMQIITKSGGNTFSGSALFQLQPESWNFSNVEGGSSQQLSYYNPGVSIGGPIIRDKLWFLASWKYDWENLGYADTQAVDSLNRERRGHLWYGKLTAQITPRNRASLSLGYDRVDIRNTGDTRYSLPEALTVQHRGGPLVSGQWTSTLSNTSVFEVTAGFNQKPNVNDSQGSGPRLRYHDSYLGNIVRFEQNDYRNYDSDRDTVYVHPQFTFFPARDLFGRHEFKVGMEARPWQKITRAYIYNVDGRGLYEYYYGLDYARYGLTEPYLYEAREAFPPGPYNSVRVQGYAAYVQDRWHPTPGMTISAGLRWEKFIHTTDGRNELPESLELFDPDIRNNEEFNDAGLAPRFGFAYDLGRHGVIRASAGRFFEYVGTGDYNNYPRDVGFNTWRVPVGRFGAGPEALTIFTSGTIPVNPAFNRDMKMEFNDELTVGHERRLPWNLAVDATYIWRSINISESSDANVVFNPDATFARIDPRFDRVDMRQFLAGDDRYRTFRFQSLQLSLRRNFTRRIGLMASYSRYWTKEDVVRFDPTETFQFAYNNPDDLDRTNYGPDWNYKFSSFYMFPRGFSLALFFNATAGVWTNDLTGDYQWNASAPRVTLPNGRRVADIIWQARNSYYVDRQYGVAGRYTDDIYNMNVRLHKEFPVGGRYRVEAAIDFFNVFNSAGYTNFETADVRNPRYGNKINPQRPRATQLNFRFVF